MKMLNIYEIKSDIKEKYITMKSFTFFIGKNQFSGFLSKITFFSLKILLEFESKKMRIILSESRKRKKKGALKEEAKQNGDHKTKTFVIF